MNAAPFRRRTVILIATACALSLIGGLVLSAILPAPADVSGPSALSVSALGYRALMTLLEDQDIPVLASRHDSGRRAGTSGLLILAEPDVAVVDTEGRARARRMIGEASHVLLVLPKWTWSEDFLHRGWVRKVARHDPERAELLLDLALPDGLVSYVPSTPVPTWTTDDLPAPLVATSRLQLIQTDSGEALVETDAGALVVQRPGRRSVTVLSDPDVLSNAGLHRGRNAEFAVALVRRLLPEGGTVIFDETLHGLAETPSIWRKALTFPLVLVTAHVLLLGAVLLWAGMGRFGAPEPPPPPLEPGTRRLVRDTADLLSWQKHGMRVLPRYLRTAARAAAMALQAPAALRGASLVEWLDRAGERRGVTLSVATLEEEARAALAQENTREALGVARRIHRWKQEILHGPRIRGSHS